MNDGARHGANPPLRVRPAVPEDAGAVTALLEAAYPVSMAPAYPQTVLRLALPVMTRANPRLLRSGRFFLAEDAAGAVVGCGGWSTERPGDRVIQPGVVHVRHFATHPDWGRRGVGRAIFEVCRHQAEATGATVFECYASLNAVPFYAALGFGRVGEHRISLTPRRHILSVHMIRSL